MRVIGTFQKGLQHRKIGILCCSQSPGGYRCIPGKKTWDWGWGQDSQQRDYLSKHAASVLWLCINEPLIWIWGLKLTCGSRSWVLPRLVTTEKSSEWLGSSKGHGSESVIGFQENLLQFQITSCHFSCMCCVSFAAFNKTISSFLINGDLFVKHLCSLSEPYSEGKTALYFAAQHKSTAKEIFGSTRSSRDIFNPLKLKGKLFAVTRSPSTAQSGYLPDRATAVLLWEQCVPRSGISGSSILVRNMNVSQSGFYIRRGSDWWTNGLVSMWCWEVDWLGTEGSVDDASQSLCPEQGVSSPPSPSPNYTHTQGAHMIIFPKSRALSPTPLCSIWPTSHQGG